MIKFKKIGIFGLSIILPTSMMISSQLVKAQSIISQPNSAGTQVIQQGKQFNIIGGATSKDGANLFHSFTQFGLMPGEIANFQSNPKIQNILSRITGGDASLINGLIKVTGGNSNLYLMNPAGIIFGPNASLNVPASFMATTATSIYFNSGIFQMIGENNYADLVGTPSAFSFELNQPGSLINAGDLTAGKNLVFLGGTIINTGQLQAPHGTISMVILPGQSRIKISQEGHLLSLELIPSQLQILNQLENSQDLVITPLSISQLLTVSGINHANQITVNSDGTLLLNGSGLRIENGDIVITGNLLNSLRDQTQTQTSQTFQLAGNQINLSAHHNLTLVETKFNASKNLNLLANNTVRIRDSAINQLQVIAGNDLTIQGKNYIDILALNSSQVESAFQAGENLQLRSNGKISTDAHFSAGNNFSILDLTGNPQSFFSLYDPIIYANGSVIFGDYSGPSLKVEATGSITGGKIMINAPDLTLSNSNDPEAAILRNAPSLILRSGVSSVSNSANVPPIQFEGGTVFSPIPTSQANQITVRDIVTEGGPAILESAGNVVIDSITTKGGNITVDAQNNINILGGLNTTNSLGNSGNIRLSSPQNIEVFNINTQGTDSFSSGTVNINAGNFFRSTGTFNSQNSTTASISTADSRNGGAITIQHGGSTTTPFVIGNAPNNGTAGAITSGLETISPTLTVPVPPAIYTQGNINIITTAPDVPELTPTPVPTSTPNLDIPSELIKNLQSRRFIEPQASNFPEFVNPESPLSLDFDVVSNTLRIDQTITLNLQLINVLENNLAGNTEFVKLEDEFLEAKNRSQSSIDLSQVFSRDSVDNRVWEIERLRTQEFQRYFGLPVTTDNEISTLDESQRSLKEINQKTGKTAALIYLEVKREGLEIIAVMADRPPIYRTVPQAQAAVFLPTISAFRSEVTNPGKWMTTSYLASAQELYQWIIQPIETELKEQKVETLLFSMPPVLRSLPVAALHDGRQFLIEKYSVALIPSFNLIDTRYQPIKTAEALAMGASIFEDLPALPAVPLEINAVVEERKQGQIFLNENFTLETLKRERFANPYQVIHLATHAEFQPGNASNSYIQLWDQKLLINQIRDLQWNQPAVELLVLSACRTALGDAQAELGFAGLSVATGAKSVVASLWYVSDLGTLTLMSEFYSQLNDAAIKAEALQKAQIALLSEQVRIENGRLVGFSSGREIELPASLKSQGNFINLKHPYYWSSFITVGSPW
jgi:filamentous hemagglutinin family protein